MPSIKITVHYTPNPDDYANKSVEGMLEQDIELLKSGGLSVDEFIEFNSDGVLFEGIPD